MPIYDYECKKCKHKFDIMHKISETPVVHCPQCSVTDVERLISAVGFQLNGSGWYVTDFKNKPAYNQQDKVNATATDAKSSAVNTKETATKSGNEN